MSSKPRKNPFDVPPNHRLLATRDALVSLYRTTGLIGVTAKVRDAEVNHHLVGLGKSEVSKDLIRKAMRILKAR